MVLYIICHKKTEATNMTKYSKLFSTCLSQFSVHFVSLCLLHETNQIEYNFRYK